MSQFPYECPLCSAEFAQVRLLHAHLFDHLDHDVFGWRTCWCGKPIYRDHMPDHMAYQNPLEHIVGGIASQL